MFCSLAKLIRTYSMYAQTVAHNSILRYICIYVRRYITAQLHNLCTAAVAGNSQLACVGTLLHLSCESLQYPLALHHTGAGWSPQSEPLTVPGCEPTVRTYTDRYNSNLWHCSASTGMRQRLCALSLTLETACCCEFTSTLCIQQ